MNEMNDLIPPESVEEKAPAENTVTKALKSPLFMTVTLLFTISFGIDTLLSFFLSGYLSLDIITLLTIIGLWMTYSAAKNTASCDSVPFSGMNLVSGTVKAVRIICLVISILCMIASVAFIIMILLVNIYPAISEAYMGQVQAILYILIKQAFGMFDSASMATTFSIFMAVISALAGTLFYIVGYRLFLKKAHRFVYSLCENLKHGTPVENGKPLFIWLLVLGILCSAYTVTMGTSILTSGVSAAALIVASCWVKAYFIPQSLVQTTSITNQ